MTQKSTLVSNPFPKLWGQIKGTGFLERSSFIAIVDEETASVLDQLALYFPQIKAAFEWLDRDSGEVRFFTPNVHRLLKATNLIKR